MRRVVVTGIGIVSCIGNNSQEVLSSLREGKSGITKSEEHVDLGFRSQIYGKPTLDPEEYLDKKLEDLWVWGLLGILYRCNRLLKMRD